jgi:hypothetical protein
MEPMPSTATLTLEAIDVPTDPADRHELHLFLDERPKAAE